MHYCHYSFECQLLNIILFLSILSSQCNQSLKLLWLDDDKNRVKRVDPDLDDILSEALDRGDTLKQLFHSIESKERIFGAPPRPVVVPLWVKEWEDSEYAINFFPPSFSAWVSIVDD